MLSLSGCLSRLGGVMISSILLTIATNNIYTMTMSWYENAFCITGPLWDERNAPSLVESPHRPTSKRDLYVAVDLRRHGAYPYVALQWLANNKRYGCCHLVHALMRLHCNVKSSPWLIKDLSMMYRALWDRRHEGATRISQCTRRVAPSALTYPSGPWVPPISQCTIHHA